ncbi:aminopeptidase P family protein [Candidatus Roizmanbacteria bacterium]|nr:aminopeptidase P family protein [Candidatus Roizmanbacteria bacterium]
MLQRLEKFRKTLKEKNIDAFLVSNFYNILYLSGFKTLVPEEREAWLLITTKNSYVFTDSRYSSTQTKNLRLLTAEKELIKHLQEIISEEKIMLIGIEGDDLKLNEFQNFHQYLNGVKLVPTERLVIKQREIKDKEEVEKISKACRISDECLTEIVKTIKVGQTEKEIAFKLEFWLKEKGYDLAFYPIVAIDENSALAHYDTKSKGDKKVSDGSVVLIDFGAKYKDYMSDITRMVFVGKTNTKIINAYNSLLDSQTKTIEKLNMNKTSMLKDTDLYCRQLLTSHSPLFSYNHSTGHGVGLEVHEYPKIAPRSGDQIFPGQVITVEPGVYFENSWGMRIEDTVLVKEDDVEVLTKFSKKPLII